MGNRAHVVFVQGHDISPAVYLHWNGGMESVEAFLAELTRRGVTGGYADDMAARFVQVVGEFFSSDADASGHRMSLAVRNGPDAITPKALKDFDHGDNGVYVVSVSAGDVPQWWVRRFARASHGGELREVDAGAVIKARDAARRHDYADGIAGVFADLERYRQSRVSTNALADAPA